MGQAHFGVLDLAISGLPLLNGFASEWLMFQALLFGFASTPGLVRLNFPLGGAMLALTTALAAACFVRAFGISFLALPRSRGSAEAHESPAVMLMPPTLIASIYGMNFRHMPELDWEFGYPVGILIMIVSAVLPYIYFKRRGWF